MDGRKKAEAGRVELEFLGSQSASRRAKAAEFWRYLDGQDALKPYQPPKPVVEQDKPADLGTRDNSSSSEASSSAKSTGAKPKQKVAKDKKRVNSETCKLEKYFREDLRYADSVEVSYDELNAEIEDYQRRLLQCNCKDKTCDCQKRKFK